MFIQEERQLRDTVAWHKVLIRKGYFFIAVHFEGFIENYPFLLKAAKYFEGNVEGWTPK